VPYHSGFHSRARRCASASWAGVILAARGEMWKDTERALVTVTTTHAGEKPMGCAKAPAESASGYCACGAIGGAPRPFLAASGLGRGLCVREAEATSKIAAIAAKAGKFADIWTS
jgi:hypothetical protein